MEVPPSTLRFLQYYTIILQRIRIIAVDAGFEPGISAPEVWRAPNEPPHLRPTTEPLVSATTEPQVPATTEPRVPANEPITESLVPAKNYYLC